MSAAAIVKTLAKEFSVDVEHAQRVFDLLNAGSKVPTIARYRRAEIGSFVDGTIRRFARRMREFDELDKRRATLIKAISEQKASKGSEGATEASLERLRNCTDRAQLEDLFLPHRRPEPEVQLALDRGLGALADLLVEPAPKSERAAEPEAPQDAAPADAPAEATEDADEAADTETSGEALADAEPAPGPAAETTAAQAATPEATDKVEDKQGATEEPAPSGVPPVHGLHIDLTLELAKACRPFVKTDRGVHTDEQALEGAVRILADRLGRNPGLRSTLRNTMRKNGRISVRGLVSDKELGTHRALLKLNTPLKQLQGHKLLALRQAQSQRHIATTVSIDEKLVLPKVRAALGKHVRPEFQNVADAVAEQALRQRLLPIIEDEVRNELRERADDEAIRFLSQHLRQTLLAPPAGPRRVAGVHVDPKGDWLIALVAEDGTPDGEPIKIAAGSLEPAPLAEALGASLRDANVRALVMGSSKGLRAAVLKLRETLNLLNADASVFLVNDGGLSSYANSEPARRELPDHTAPARQAIGLARRLQDPLAEFVKGEMRHLGLGREQSIISKANLRRVMNETVESCVAFVGCDLNSAPLTLLRHVPGLSFELAKKLVERRAERPFASREELRTEGLLDDTAWTNAIGFLRVAGSSEPLDRTALHPEQYDLARRIILDSGGSVEETLGRRDAAKGLRRANFEIDEYTWRDLVREISHPGRDPRMRTFPPRVLPVDFDVKTLEKDQVIEGIVSSVTSFGAFVDLGVKREGMVHISEISDRYVRDARTLLSIGQVIRARVLNATGPRVELSLKKVPPPARTTGMRGGGGGAAGGAGGNRGRRSGGRGGEREGKPAFPEYQPVVRAARTRRDGLGNAAPEKGRRGGGGGGRGGPNRSGPGRGGKRGARDDQYDPAAVREASKSAGSYNPFASFFDKGEASGDDAGGADSK